MMLVSEFGTSTRTEKSTEYEILASHGTQKDHGRGKKTDHLKGSSALLFRTVASYGAYQINKGWRTSNLLSAQARHLLLHSAQQTGHDIVPMLILSLCIALKANIPYGQWPISSFGKPTYYPSRQSRTKSAYAEKLWNARHAIHHVDFSYKRCLLNLTGSFNLWRPNGGPQFVGYAAIQLRLS